MPSSSSSSSSSPSPHIVHLWTDLNPSQTGSLDLPTFRTRLRQTNNNLQHLDNLVDSLFRRVDHNRDGRIDFEEFTEFVTAAEGQLRSLFDSIDTSGCGSIGRLELEDAFARAGVIHQDSRQDDGQMRKYVHALFDQLDRNDDGVISWEEWRDFLLFMPTAPAATPTPVDKNKDVLINRRLRAVLTYFVENTTTVNPEGDVHINQPESYHLGKRNPLSLLYS